MITPTSSTPWIAREAETSRGLMVVGILFMFCVCVVLLWFVLSASLGSHLAPLFGVGAVFTRPPRLKRARSCREIQSYSQAPSQTAVAPAFKQPFADQKKRISPIHTAQWGGNPPCE